MGEDATFEDTSSRPAESAVDDISAATAPHAGRAVNRLSNAREPISEVGMTLLIFLLLVLL
jgi:hypothetical protein